MNNEAVLRAINIEIGEKEDQADRDYFARRLAPKFAMRRANGSLVERATYIENLKISGPRSTLVESVSVLGRCRAIVTCTVLMDEREYANLRIFVRENERDEWQMLAWANELIPLGFSQRE